MSDALQKSVVLFLLLALICFPVAASAFGTGGCGEGACADCHSFTQDEASDLLKGIVDKVYSVEFSNVPGLWTIDAEGRGSRGYLYVDFSKSFVLAGRVIRISDKTDVTAGSDASPRKIDPAEMPFDEGLLLGRKEAKTKIAVFTDPLCPYCQKLHVELKKVVEERPEVAFSLFLFPLPSHPESSDIVKTVLCENSLELLEESFAGKEIPPPSCETDIVDRNVALTKKFDIRSTPTLVFPDGGLIFGYRTADALKKLLDASAASEAPPVEEAPPPAEAPPAGYFPSPKP